MEARKEEKRESKGKRFGWRIDKLFNQRDTLSYKIFVFRSEKETTKREERKKVKRSGDVLVVTAKKIRKKKRCVKIRKRRRQNQSLCSFYSRNTNPCCLTERETLCSPIIKHHAPLVIIFEVYFYANCSCRISWSISGLYSKWVSYVKYSDMVCIHRNFENALWEWQKPRRRPRIHALTDTTGKNEKKTNKRWEAFVSFSVEISNKFKYNLFRTERPTNTHDDSRNGLNSGPYRKLTCDGSIE